MECREVRDLPTGPALLALARDVLLRDLMPLLPQEAHLEARLVANSMAIAGREAVAGDEPAREILREVEKLYGETGSGNLGLLARLARDLRGGVLELSEPREHHAREILWRLTIAKLRDANPRFLNANGFS
jgi:RNase P/RNase MRP subunit POP5